MTIEEVKNKNNIIINDIDKIIHENQEPSLNDWLSLVKENLIQINDSIDNYIEKTNNLVTLLTKLP